MDKQLSTRDLAGTDRDDTNERQPTHEHAADQAERSARLDASEDEDVEFKPAIGAEAAVKAAAGEAHRAEPSSLSGEDGDESLLPSDQTNRFLTSWGDIQSSFVDQPRQSVEKADARRKRDCTSLRAW